MNKIPFDSGPNEHIPNSHGLPKALYQHPNNYACESQEINKLKEEVKVLEEALVESESALMRYERMVDLQMLIIDAISHEPQDRRQLVLPV